ncbi:hypothetical protein BDV93DRAFT_553224 [Ceratobasidium sp. AG-I]|nr:hypothetical protein BDV93DRAFT_553224 [Ceratobasidium sp. AG-I]
MPPLRPESSTVSMPPRERALARRRAKAIQNGEPIPRPSDNGVKQKGKALAPTLASTRKRRPAALDVAYIDRADGYHIKQVVRRPVTPKHAPPVQYLPGQEDIPRSDNESDDDTASTATTATVPDLDFPVGDPDADIDMDDAYPEVLPAWPEDIDNDADGETDDETMEDIARPPRSPADRTFDTSWGSRPSLTLQPWPGVPDQSHDLIGSVSEQDMRDLFAGLDGLSTGFHDNIPAHFPSSSPANNSVFGSQYLNTQGLGSSTEVNIAFGLSHHHSHNTWVTNHPAQPSVPVNYPEAPSTSTSRSLRITPSQAPSSRGSSTPLASLSPPPHHPAQPESRIATPDSTSGPPRSLARSNTRELVAQARSQARPPTPTIPPLVTIPHADLLAGPLLRVPPLRRSLNLPSFLGGGDGDSSNDDRTWPSTPVTIDETDIGLTKSSPMPVTQAQSRAARAARYFNIRVLPQPASEGPLRIPTTLELQLNACKVYKTNRRRIRARNTAATESATRRNLISSADLSKDQRAVISQMEYHFLKNVLFVDPWPTPEVRQIRLLEAQQYATGLTRVSGDEVFSQRFLDTVYDKTSANRSNSLAKIKFMMEEKFGVGTSNKQMIRQLMVKDLFLFPTINREPSEYFCIDAIGSALEIILFKCSKPIGEAFMEELCKPDEPADWHKKLCDQTARKGVPPGLLAFAATQMYWALEMLYRGTTLAFDEHHYHEVWKRYLRALERLPHLGRLRVDMLDRIKEYYLAHWPGEEPNVGEVSFPAW